MLKKLLKYEFRATARTYGGMYLALLAASVLFGGSLWRWNSTNSDAYSTLVGLLSLVYTGVIIGTVVVTIMTIVQRFYRNLLGREGYLMYTLPVTETQLVTSKLISSTVWSLCSILAACLSFGILAVLMMADMDLLEQLPLMWSGIREAFARCNMEFWEALAFSGVVGFVRMVSAIACIYAACMVGHQFKNHPALAGILSFFVMQYLQGWLEKLLQIGTSLLTVIGSFVMLLMLSPLLSGVFFLTVPLSVLLTRLQMKHIHPLFRRRSQELGALNSFAEERVSCQRAIRVYGVFSGAPLYLEHPTILQKQ